MKGLAKESLTEGILKWLPRCQLVDESSSHRLPNTLSKNEHDEHACLVVSWMDGSGNTVLTVVGIEPDLVGKLQMAIEEDDPDLAEGYMEKIEDYVVFRAVSHDNGDAKVWQLTTEILTNTYF